MATNLRPLPRQLLDSTISVNPSPINSPTNGGVSNFDTQMVIILIALLCLLICATGLTSIIRCTLRFYRRVSIESGGELPVVITPKKDDFSWIPVVVYKSGDITAMECPICLAEYVEGEDVRILPRCNHGFHAKCVTKWLALHSSCPTCRQFLVKG